MAHPAPADLHYTTERYLALVEQGILGPDDRVELLEGVIVAMSPQNPRHAAATRRLDAALRDAVGERAVVSVQLPLVTGSFSIPEPDVAVLPGQQSDYDRVHPSRALLVVEVADTSLMQDRLTKAAIYAAANVPEYWLVNLRDNCVEVFRRPDVATATYSERSVSRRGDRITLVAFADASVAVDDVLPA
jgi:Uma2 family endonuclease